MERIEFLNKVKELLPPNPMCIEIGVYRGEFAEMIFDVLQPKELNLIDPYKIGEEFYPDGLRTSYSTKEDFHIASERFSKKDADGVNFWLATSYHVSDRFNDGAYDFIYVDGSHLYKDVLRDLVMYEDKLSVQSLLCGHDYNSSFEGVKEAVDDFCLFYDYEMLLLNPNGGDFALRKK